MDNENNNKPQNGAEGSTPTSATPGQTPAPQGSTPNGPPQKTSLDSLPEDIQAYIKDLRKEAEDARKQKEAEAKAKKVAEEARLKEQGEFQKLAEQRQARVAELEAEIARRDHDALRTKVIAKHGLAPEFAARLKGTTEAELDADATELKKLVGATTKPGNAPNPTPSSPGGEDPAQKYYNRLRGTGRYGA